MFVSSLSSKSAWSMVQRLPLRCSSKFRLLKTRFAYCGVCMQYELCSSISVIESILFGVILVVLRLLLLLLRSSLVDSISLVGSGFSFSSFLVTHSV